MEPVGWGEPPGGSSVTAAARTGPSSGGTSTEPEAEPAAGSKTPALIFDFPVMSQS
jgi:hypothetical protein